MSSESLIYNLLKRVTISLNNTMQPNHQSSSLRPLHAQCWDTHTHTHTHTLGLVGELGASLRR
jgi:hypothetical protein